VATHPGVSKEDSLHGSAQLTVWIAPDSTQSKPAQVTIGR